MNRVCEFSELWRPTDVIYWLMASHFFRVNGPGLIEAV